MEPRTFIMAGGGTGGHVIPAIAVARELARRGHQPVFVGTAGGFEASLVPSAGFPLEVIEIGGLKRVGPAQRLRTLGQLPVSTRRVLALLDRHRPAAVFSMGGYVAGPVMLAAWWRRLPIAVMEPNAIPGFTNRSVARFVSRALLSFPEAARYFPKHRTEVTGLPVRREFFEIPPRSLGDPMTVLITGGSRGSRTLNEAARDGWSYFRHAPFPIRVLHQTGSEAYAAISREFAEARVDGRVTPFIDDMPAAFAAADLVVCRSGAGAVAELAAAGKPSLLVPFPFAADNHQLRNAEAFARAGAAKLILDREMNGRRLFEEIAALGSDSSMLEAMGSRARAFAHPHAAERAADILEMIAEERPIHAGA
jgi:UDP-N-acetylglucosamine--N-acetylmuramyl-(pentapeptide) pyrophosphoryl-undecaprenol N-acetylglucosamine transferase